MTKPCLFAALASSAIAAVPATASVDRSAPPGGVYRLKPGIYVAQGSGCQQPANAAIRQYDGRGISTAHSRACQAKIATRKGGAFSVIQSCLDAGAGTARRFTERQTIRVHDALTFDQGVGTAKTRYAYCPPHELPLDLRKAVR